MSNIPEIKTPIDEDKDSLFDDSILVNQSYTISCLIDQFPHATQK